MGDTTKISWTDATFNPWQGCVKVSPACANCYAERDTKRFGKVIWGGAGTRVITSDDYWKKPLKWDRDAKAAGIRTRVFCASLADVFERWHGPMKSNTFTVWKCNCGNWFCADGQQTPCDKCGDLRASMVTMNDVRRRLFKLIDATPNLDWLLLTKRPENIDDMWQCKDDTDGDGHCHVCIRASNAPCRKRHNVWLGTSVENQEYAEKRIPELLKCRELSPVLFLSCEPLLGPVDLTEILTKEAGFALQWLSKLYRNPDGSPSSGINMDANGKEIKRVVIDPLPINWIIAGGESGPNARPTNADWFRSLRDQCSAAGVPFHFKQHGEFDQYGMRVGKAAAGNMLDGRYHLEFPEGAIN